MKVWTEEEERILTEMYPHPDYDTEDMMARLGKTKNQIYSCAARLGLKAPRERMVRMGKRWAETVACKEHRFKKGQISHNKGKKTPPEIYAKIAPTMFKKGNRPHNYKPIGTEIITEDGYIKIKVGDPKQWKYKHRMIWEQHNGPIPPKHNIQFKDGNSLNCDISNLYMISQSEQMKDNSYLSRYPQELCEVIRLKGAVKRRINTIIRKENEKEQHEPGGSEESPVRND